MSADLDAKKQKLKDEIDKLKYEFKIEIPKRIAHAAAYGDLKENADYHAARERQGFVKALISQLTMQLSQLNEIRIDNIPTDRIDYGAMVTVRDLDSEDIINFTLVSPNEVNPREGKISLSSPIGAALRSKMVGDEVEANIPAGNRRFCVEKIETIHGNVIEKS